MQKGIPGIHEDEKWYAVPTEGILHEDVVRQMQKKYMDGADMDASELTEKLRSALECDR